MLFSLESEKCRVTTLQLPAAGHSWLTKASSPGQKWHKDQETSRRVSQTLHLPLFLFLLNSNAAYTTIQVVPTPQLKPPFSIPWQPKQAAFYSSFPHIKDQLACFYCPMQEETKRSQPQVFTKQKLLFGIFSNTSSLPTHRKFMTVFFWDSLNWLVEATSA